MKTGTMQQRKHGYVNRRRSQKGIWYSRLQNFRVCDADLGDRGGDSENGCGSDWCERRNDVAGRGSNCDATVTWL